MRRRALAMLALLGLCSGSPAGPPAAAARATGVPYEALAREPVGRDTAAHVLGWALHLTGDPVPAEAPRFVVLSEGRMRELACEAGARACTPIALFRPAEPDRIYLLDLLDPDARIGDRAVLVHELVHWLQEKRAARGTACEREGEAYRLQARYLEAHGVRLGRAAGSHGVRPAAALEWACE